jgi:hypothetical protein
MFFVFKWNCAKAIAKGLKDGLKYNRKPIKNKYPYILIEGFGSAIKAIIFEIKKHLLQRI